MLDFNEALKLGMHHRGHSQGLKEGGRHGDPKVAEAADQVSHALYQRGMAHIDKLDYDAAILDFEDAMKLTPDDPRPLLGRGADLSPAR